MSDIKIVFLDIDGTIRNSNKEIEPITKDSIKRAVEAGIKIVLCTGRSCKYAKEVAKELDLQGYLISSNGSEVIDLCENKIIYNADLDFEEVEKLYDYCKEHGLNYLLNTAFEDYQTINESNNRITISRVDEIKEPINQVVVTSYNYLAMRNLLDNFTSFYKKMRISSSAKSLNLGNLNPDNDYYLDINRFDSSKATGIHKLLEYLNIDKSNAVACGDGINDYEMLQAVGIGVAMGNAWDELKEVADFVTKTNDDYGVAYLLDKIIKKEL